MTAAACNTGNCCRSSYLGSTSTRKPDGAPRSTRCGCLTTNGPRCELDYYTKTTFEFVHDGLGAQSGIGGGGRYDGLMHQLGGQDLSGIGFGLGVDRTLLALRAEGKSVGETTRCDVFGVPLSEPAKLQLAVLAAQLRDAGVRVDIAYGERGLKGAMRAADRSGARIALVLGDRDIEAGTVGVKDLGTGDQVSVALDSVVAEVISKLGR
jgi:histidyl-tRNA synthetase